MVCDECFYYNNYPKEYPCNVCKRLSYFRLKEKSNTLDKETDPTGKDQHEDGAKLDEGKIRYGLIPTSPLKWLAKLYTVGAKKYSENGWKKVPNGRKRYVDALYRHLEAYRGGEWMDEDTGVPHLINVAWNAFAIVWIKENK